MTSKTREPPPEWDAAIYHCVPAPQVARGSRVLERLPFSGTETVIDAGRGTGRLTENLLERPPRDRVIAVDRFANMLAEAAASLTPRKAAGWLNPWGFAKSEETALRLVEAGFVTIETSLEPDPIHNDI